MRRQAAAHVPWAVKPRRGQRQSECCCRLHTRHRGGHHGARASADGTRRRADGKALCTLAVPLESRTAPTIEADGCHSSDRSVSGASVHDPMPPCLPPTPPAPLAPDPPRVAGSSSAAPLGVPRRMHAPTPPAPSFAAESSTSRRTPARRRRAARWRTARAATRTGRDWWPANTARTSRLSVLLTPHCYYHRRLQAAWAYCPNAVSGDRTGVGRVLQVPAPVELLLVLVLALLLMVKAPVQPTIAAYSMLLPPSRRAAAIKRDGAVNDVSWQCRRACPCALVPVWCRTRGPVCSTTHTATPPCATRCQRLKRNGALPLPECV